MHDTYRATKPLGITWRRLNMVKVFGNIGTTAWIELTAALNGATGKVRESVK